MVTADEKCELEDTMARATTDPKGNKYPPGHQDAHDSHEFPGKGYTTYNGVAQQMADSRSSPWHSNEVMTTGSLDSNEFRPSMSAKETRTKNKLRKRKRRRTQNFWLWVWHKLPGVFFFLE
jgi:hypothetical protein